MSDIASDKWLKPWGPVPEEDRQGLEYELRTELQPGHALYGRTAKAVARRQDNDDVLFAIESPNEFAVVHLDWCLHPEPIPEFPWTNRFASFDEFVRDCMVHDHEEGHD